MNRTLKIYIAFLVALLVLIIVVDANRPKPINWSPSFDVNAKIPFGLYVFDTEKDTFFKGDTLETIKTTPYEFFDSFYDYDTLVNSYEIKGTFLAIAEDYFIDQSSTDELLTFVGHGNTAFLSMSNFSITLEDSLKFEYKNKFFQNEMTVQLSNPSLDTTSYPMKIGANGYYFSKFDTLTTTVLGYQKIEKEQQVNFIKVNYGDGQFYLHLQPMAFTNYYLLKDKNAAYAEHVLSYIPKGKLFWYPNQVNKYGVSNSPLRFILSHESLKWAWYLFLLGMIIFMIFNAKRKQRIIPIIKPLANTTVDFTKTIGNLYFQEGNHDTIMEKKIIYFLEKIRHDYLIDTQILDEEFIKKVNQKTGKERQLIEKVVLLIKRQRKTFKSSEADLVELNRVIEKILDTTK